MYGLHSSILVRSVLDLATPEMKSAVPVEIRLSLESLEAVAEQNFNKLLEEINVEWKMGKELRKNIESAIAVLSEMEGQDNE